MQQAQFRPHTPGGEWQSATTQEVTAIEVEMSVKRGSELKRILKKAMLSGTLSFAHPPRFRVYQSDGYEVRFVGNTLVIDHALFQTTGSPYLCALLAHAL